MCSGAPMLIQKPDDSGKNLKIDQSQLRKPVCTHENIIYNIDNIKAHLANIMNSSPAEFMIYQIINFQKS